MEQLRAKVTIYPQLDGLFNLYSTFKRFTNKAKIDNDYDRKNRLRMKNRMTLKEKDLVFLPTLTKKSRKTSHFRHIAICPTHKLNSIFNKMTVKFSVQIFDKSTGNPIYSKKVGVIFNGWTRGCAKDQYTDRNGEAHFPKIMEREPSMLMAIKFLREE